MVLLNVTNLVIDSFSAIRVFGKRKSNKLLNLQPLLISGQDQAPIIKEALSTHHSTQRNFHSEVPRVIKDYHGNTIRRIRAAMRSARRIKIMRKDRGNDAESTATGRH